MMYRLIRRQKFNHWDCFGHQIIAASLGGKVNGPMRTAPAFVVHYNDGKVVNAVFTHQIRRRLENSVIASSSAANLGCRHPHRPIYVQFHLRLYNRYLMMPLVRR